MSLDQCLTCALNLLGVVQEMSSQQHWFLKSACPAHGNCGFGKFLFQGRVYVQGSVPSVGHSRTPLKTPGSDSSRALFKSQRSAVTVFHGMCLLQQLIYLKSKSRDTSAGVEFDSR